MFWTGFIAGAVAGLAGSALYIWWLISNEPEVRLVDTDGPGD